MAYETEMKVWVENWDELERELRARLHFNRSFTKRDRYFRSPEPDKAPPGGPSFRVREDDGSVVVTFKTKSIRKGFEFNQEQEFHVDNPDAFVAFAERIGFVCDISKVKHGLSFTDHDLHAELVEIQGLGRFLEVEFVNEDADEDLHEAAAERIRAFFESLPVDLNRIEERSYTRLLHEHR